MNSNPYSFGRTSRGLFAPPALLREFFWALRLLLGGLLLLLAPAARATAAPPAPGRAPGAAPTFLSYLAGTPWAVIDPLRVTSTNTPVSCYGNTDGTIQVVISGGLAPYTLRWTVGTSPVVYSRTIAGAGPVLLTGLPAGEYYFALFDANGDRSNCFDNLIQPDAYRIVLTPMGTGCSGSPTGRINTSVRGGTPPYDFQWSNGATSENLNGLTAGSYTLNVTDVNGCTGSATVVVPAATTITATIASKTDASCLGSSTGSITLAVSGGAAPYSFRWSNGATTQNLSGLLAGTYSVTVTDAGGCTGTGTATILEPAALRPSVAATRPSCFGGATGGAAAAASGGTPPYTFLWSNGATTAGLSGVPGGTYTVVITDANGCTASGSATVSISTQLTAAATKTDVSCVGGSTGSIMLTLGGGTAPFTFQWSNGATTQNLSDLRAGTYTVTVTDANGCTATAGAAIGQPTPLQASATPTPATCFGSATGTVALSVSGGTAPYAYLWSNGATTQNLSGLAAGSYSVSIIDANGCTASASATVGEPTALTALSTPTATTCFASSDGSISLAVSGGTVPYTFLWSTGATTQNVSGLPAGSYSVTVTDAHGCTSSCGGNVLRPTLLVASASAMPASCAGSATGAVALSVSGGTAPFTFLWSNGATSQNLSGLSAGPYSVSITDAHGCTAAASATVGQSLMLHASSQTMDASCFNAANGSVDLSISGGTPPYTYLWSNGATTQDLVGLVAGTYSVTITDSHGCTATSTATIRRPALLQASATPTPAACFGSPTGAVALSVSGGTSPYSYLWSNGAATQNLSALGAGTYTVTVTDANGCTASCGATISQPVAMRPSVTVTAANCCASSSGSVDLSVSGGTAPYSYRWSNGASTQDLSNVAAGTYTVTITDALGCTAPASATITQPTALQASTSSTNASCAGSDGTATVVASGGTAPYSYRWSPGGQSTATATGLASGSYTVIITDARGCTLTASAAVLAASCRAQHCTLTQGGYGNSCGVICKEPSKRRLQLIADMFTSTDLVLGAPGRSLTYSYAGGSSAAAALARQATAQCIIDKMPAGGPAAAFPGTLGNASGCASSFPTSFLKNGRFGNVLVGQTLALALNMRLDNTLGGVPLSATMTSYATLSCSLPDPSDLTGISRSIPASVLGSLSYLGGTPTVGGLLVLANKALGGVAYANSGGNPSVSDIACAVGALNELFDECRIFGASRAVRGLAAGPATSAPASSLNRLPAGDDNNLSAYPNPFTTSTTLTFGLPLAAKYSLVVYDLTGSEVARVSSGLAEAGVRYRFVVGTGLQEGVYVARLLTADGTQTIRLNVLH